MADDRYFWAKTRRNYDFEKHGMQLYVSLLFFSTRLPLPESAYLSEMVILSKRDAYSFSQTQVSFRIHIQTYMKTCFV
jgi:hypothetical protein